MTVIALRIEYDGSPYHGWQRQPQVPTVQATLETALSKIADAPIEIVCAGRTDTGVHAKGQVVHFTTSVQRRLDAWVRGTNSALPSSVAVTGVQVADDAFHARFSALRRHYRYVIYNRPMHPTHMRNYVAWESRPLDAEAMHIAAQSLLGEHDFSAFRGADCQSKSPMRCVHDIQVTRRGHLVLVDVVANAFLHHMVRNIVGTLLMVGDGSHPAAWVKEVLCACDRKLAGVTAKPGGLYLMRVEYPTELFMEQSL